ncbi:MAG: hypothetical protein QXY36_01085 [Sulfolobales archaeon]
MAGPSTVFASEGMFNHYVLTVTTNYLKCFLTLLMVLEVVGVLDGEGEG